MKNSTITLDNVEEFSVSLLEHNLRWMFESTEDNRIPQEVEDEVIPLESAAAQFLFDFRNKQNYLTEVFFTAENLSKNETSFTSKKRTKAEIENWLKARNIPLDRKVFWVNQLNVAFVLTWKMVIKFSDVLFFGTNETLWDSSMNWTLTFESDEIFRFTDNLMFNPEERMIETQIIDEILDESLQTKAMKELFGEPVSVKDTEVVSKPSIAYRNPKLLQRSVA